MSRVVFLIRLLHHWQLLPVKVYHVHFQRTHTFAAFSTELTVELFSFVLVNVPQMRPHCISPTELFAADGTV